MLLCSFAARFGRRFLAAAVLLAACAGGVAKADLLAYEGFGYEAGPLNAQDGAGSGWAGQWYAGSNYDVVANSLSLPNSPLAVSGGHVVGTSTANRDFDQISLDVAGTYYLSYLIATDGFDTDSTTNQYADVHLRDAFTQKTNAGITSNQGFHLRDAGAGDPTTADDVVTSSDPFFVVHKIEIGSGSNDAWDDSLSLKFYSDGADITESEPAAWDLTVPVADIPYNFNKLTLWAGTAAGFSASYDEIRIATTWEEAVPFASATVEGDYNGDGSVDAADYTVWRDNDGKDESVLGGAGDGSGVVDAGDYDVWVSQYGASAPGSAVSVPEPMSCSILAGAAVALLPRRRR